MYTVYSFLQSFFEFFFLYITENTLCLTYGFNWIIEKFSFFASYVNLLADISEIFSISLLSSLLLLSILSFTVFIHKHTSSFIENNFQKNSFKSGKISLFEHFFKKFL